MKFDELKMKVISSEIFQFRLSLSKRMTQSRGECWFVLEGLTEEASLAEELGTNLLFPISPI